MKPFGTGSVVVADFFGLRTLSTISRAIGPW